MTGRRTALRAIALVAAWPSLARSQPRERVWRVGFLSPRRKPAALDADYYGAFPRRMRELGYVEGRNLEILWRFADGDYARLPGHAAELVRARVDVMLALGPPGAAAAQRATSTIPIVFVVSGDPVAAGLVRSLARPGANLTGFFNLAGDLVSKHVEMLRAVAPAVTRIALLVNPSNPAHAAIEASSRAIARSAGVELFAVPAHTADALAPAFASMIAQRAGAVVIVLDPLFIQHVPDLARLARQHALPSVFPNREFAEAGGLLSYGWNQADIYRRAAGCVDRILKGASPAVLPVEQPQLLELVVNARAAQSLGLALPPSLLSTADTVIR